MTLSYRTRTRFKRFATILSVVLVLSILVWLFWLIWLDRYIKYDRHRGAVLDFSLSSTFAPPVAESVPNTKQPVRFEDAPRPEPSAPVEQASIRGYYIDFDMLKKDMDTVQAQIDALPKGTAVVLDVKNALGGFHYSSAVGDKHSGSVDAARFDAFLKHLSERDLHLIARLPAFRDRHYGLNHIPQGLPIKGGDGALWPDSGGCYWLKPTSDTVLNYLINIAKELRSLGFDEVVFTEFRFPDTDKIVFTADKAQAITDAAAALAGASDIIAEDISDDAAIRKILRDLFGDLKAVVAKKPPLGLRLLCGVDARKHALVGNIANRRAVQENMRPHQHILAVTEILAETTVISHGMGMIDGVTTLNCLESFLAQYEKGVRIFEVDLRLTSDMQVVLRHDWRAGWQDGVSERNIPTLEEFRAKALLEKYTALSFRDLLLLMVEYPDICVVTDSKFTDAEVVTLQFEAMLRDARELGLESLFDRIVVQVYSELMFKVVDNLGDFPHYIYTLYNTGFDQSVESLEEIAKFCTENSITGVTMWSHWWKEEFAPVAQQYGLAVYVHTVNDREQACALIASGVSGVYTDEIIPDDLRPKEKPELPEKKGRGQNGSEREETVR